MNEDIDTSGMEGNETETNTTKIANIKRKARQGMKNPEKALRSEPIQRSIALVVGLNAAVGTAAAQSQAQQAGDALCGTGLGSVLALIFGGISAYLLLKAVVRGMTAFDKLGAAQSQKKKEGRQAAKGAGITGVGALVPLFAGIIFDQIGIGVFSCIDWSNIIGLSAAAIPVVPF